MSAALEFGVQFHLASTVDRYATPDLAALGEAAERGGISQVWVTDNLGARNPFVILAAMAPRVRIKLGAAVVVQYFRNPVDVADAIATLTELTGGRELGVGLARGSLSKTPQYFRPSDPVAILEETAGMLRHLLAGDGVQFARYPALTSYFNLSPTGEGRLGMRPSGPPVRRGQRASGARGRGPGDGRRDLRRIVPRSGARRDARPLGRNRGPRRRPERSREDTAKSRGGKRVAVRRSGRGQALCQAVRSHGDRSPACDGLGRG